MTVEIVYNDRDNENIVTFSDQNGAIDFTGYTRMLVRFDGSSVEADTDVTASLITGDSSGNVTFDFGALGVDAGEYPCSFIVFDGSHPNGQVLVHADENSLSFKFIDPLP